MGTLFKKERKKVCKSVLMVSQVTPNLDILILL